MEVIDRIDDGFIDFRSLYNITDDELQFQEQIRNEKTLFGTKLKQDIMQELPQYWKNRIKFRNEQAKIMQERHERRLQQNDRQRARNQNQNENTMPTRRKGFDYYSGLSE